MPKIYLSPSNQSGNTYATGNTNEMAQCEKIADAAAAALKRCGFEVKVGKAGDSMQNRCNESDAFKADIHMPIHTNAYNGKVTGGTRIFCYSSSTSNTAPAKAVLKTLGAISPGTADSVTVNTGLYEINTPKAITVYVECEFHDTKTGADWIRNNITNIGEAICKGMCNHFSYKYKSSTSTSNSATSSKPVSKPTTSNSSSGNSYIKSVQTWLNSNYKTGLVIDGIYGSNTKKALVKAMQAEMNKQYGSKLVVDGIYGSATNSAVRNLTVGCKGNITKTLQGLLICNRYSTNGFDGIFGSGTQTAVKSYQKKKGLTVDGIAGKATFSSLCK